MLKIALVVPGFSRDADDWAIPALQALACRLAEQHEVHVFSLRYPGAGHSTFCGLEHHATGGGNHGGVRSLALMARTVRAVVAEHRRAPFDLLHAFWVDEPAFVAVLAGSLLRRPVIASVGGGELVHLPAIGYGTWGSRWRRQLIRIALRGARLVTTGSLLAQQLCRERGIPTQKVIVAPLGVDTERFRPGPAAERRRAVIVQAASLTPVKNQKLLLAVAARVRAQCPELRVLVAGEGSRREELQAEAERLGLEQTVSWLGSIAHLEMPAFYQQGDLYLQSSHYESQGMAVLEAMACGLPVVGTPAGLLPEVAAQPPSSDRERLVQQILALLADRRLLAAEAEAARSSVVSRFSLDRSVARFLELYQRIGPRFNE